MNPLSGTSRGTKYSQNRTDTLIGAGVCVEGDLTFTGVLRIQGNALGDVSCDTDSVGTVVVDKSGRVTGTLSAPHVVVGGHVAGPVHSSASIEIQQGGCIAGDVDYQAIDIHPGGVIEGLLTPGPQADGDSAEQEHPIRESTLSAGADRKTPGSYATSAGRGLVERFGGARGLGVAVALLGAVILVVFVLPSRNPPPNAPEPAAADLKHDLPPKTDAAPPAATVGDGAQGAAKTVAGEAMPVASPPATESKDIGQPPPAEPADVDMQTVVTVPGVNPAKPAGVFLVISKEPSVLYRKKRHDPGKGTRFDVPRGTSESVAIAKDEIFRVTKGRDITIFYQGRKVTPKTIESGAWISFVPHSPGAPSDQ